MAAAVDWWGPSRPGPSPLNRKVPKKIERSATSDIRSALQQRLPRIKSLFTFAARPIKPMFGPRKPARPVKPQRLFGSMNKFPKRSKQEWNLIAKDSFGDKDRDGVKNMFDCKPLNRKKQGWAHRGHQFNRERTTHVKMMAPEKFLKTTLIESQDRREQWGQGQKYYDVDEFTNKVLDQKNVDRLKKVIQQPKGKMEIPYLEYDERGNPIGHEGRHRALAAKQMGVKLIPVTIARKLKEPRDWKDMRKTWKYHKTKYDWRNDLENTEEQLRSTAADVPIKEQREYGVEKPEALAALNRKTKRDILESEENKARRLRHGAIRVREIDAAEFKKQFEKQHGEKLDWDKGRLKTAMERDEDDAYPEVSFRKGRVDVNDGRHRISAAAKKGQKIEVAYADEIESSDSESSSPASEDKI